MGTETAALDTTTVAPSTFASAGADLASGAAVLKAFLISLFGVLPASWGGGHARGGDVGVRVGLALIPEAAADSVGYERRDHAVPQAGGRVLMSGTFGRVGTGRGRHLCLWALGARFGDGFFPGGEARIVGLLGGRIF